MRTILFIALLTACSEDPHEVVSCQGSWDGLRPGVLAACEFACSNGPSAVDLYASTPNEGCAALFEGGSEYGFCDHPYVVAFDGERGCCRLEGQTWQYAVCAGE